MIARGVCWAACVALAGCGGPLGDAGGGLVGVIAPADRVGSLGLTTGVELALEAWSGDVGLVQQLDGRGTVRGAVEAWQGLVEGGARVLVGPPDPEAADAVAALAARRGIPLVLVEPPRVDLGQGARWVFSLSDGPRRAAEVLAGHADASLGIETFGIITDLADTAAQDFADAFRSAAQALGDRVLIELGLVPDDPRGARALAQLLAHHPDVRAVLLSVGPDAVEALVQGTEPGTLASLVLLGGPTWSARDLAPTLRGRVAGAYAVSAFSPEDPSGRGSAFATRYRQRTGRPAPAEAALGFDALRLVLAIFEPTLSPDALRRRLASARDVSGVTGPTSFGPQGASPRAVVLEQLHDGSHPRWVSRRDP